METFAKILIAGFIIIIIACIIGVYLEVQFIREYGFYERPNILCILLYVVLIIVSSNAVSRIFVDLNYLY